MIDHATLAVTDIARSKAFYEAALAPLGLRPLFGGETFAGFGDSRPFFWIGQRPDAGRSPAHVALGAADRDQVAAFHAAALAAGGRDNGSPGPRPQYEPGYYGAFILDPDGNNIEAVVREQAPIRA